MARMVETPDTYRSDFERFIRDMSQGGPEWLRSLRLEAMLSFTDLGFPTTKEEEWRFTNISPIEKTFFRGPWGEAMTLDSYVLEGLPLAGMDATRLVFVNGHYSPQLSASNGLPESVHAAGLAKVLGNGAGLAERHLGRHAHFSSRALVALNTAHLDDGAYLHIPDGTILEKPVHLMFVSTTKGQPSVSYPRVLVVVGRGSQATVVESYLSLGEGACFSNAVTEIVVGENAIVDHYKLQREGPQSAHIATLHVHQDAHSTFTSHAVSTGSSLARNDLNFVLEEGADCTLNGLYLARGHQLIDNHTSVFHAKPNASSRELYKGVLDQNAAAVFNGKIFVAKDAQKTDARQSNKNLLLSEDAVINSTPQLEIYADDVKCTHGATVGQLDEDAVFYLRSRGIGHEAARNLLTYAFAGEVIERMKVDAIRLHLGPELNTWLSEGRSLGEAS